MPFQSGNNVAVAYKVEATFGVLPGATAAKRLRLNSGGLSLSRSAINPGELRADLKTPMGRLGSRSVGGSYSIDLSLGVADDLIEAGMRGTWVANVVVTFATMTSITTGANTIIAASGSWLTQGVRVGKIVRLANHSSAGNNGRNLRVVGVTASTITVAETLTIDAVADAAGDLTIMRNIVQPAVPVRRSWTFEENQLDIDGSEVYRGNRVTSLRFAGGPDSMATLEIGLVGADMEIMSGAAAPYFTTPTLPSGLGLTFADASLRFGGVDEVVLTAFDLSMTLGSQGVAIIGGSVTPDIFEGKAGSGGSISAIRKDLTNMTRYLAETELELHVMLVEPESEPKDFVSLFVPRIKLMTPDKSLGSEGALIESLPFMIGNKEVVTGYDDTMVLISTSAV